MQQKTSVQHISFSEKYASVGVVLLLILADYLAVLCAEETAFLIRSNIRTLYAGGYLYLPPLYFFLFVPTVFLSFLYSRQTHIQNVPFWDMMRGVFYSVLYSMLTIIMLMYFGKVADVVSRLYVLFVGVWAFFFILLFRYMLKKMLHAGHFFQVPVLIVGAGKTAELLLHSFRNDTGFGYRVIGFIDDHPVSEYLTQQYPILGGFAEAEEVIRSTGVKDIIVAAPGLAPQELCSLINRIQPLVKNVSFIPNFIGIPMSNLEVKSLFNEKLMVLQLGNNLARPANRFLKRTFDVVLTLLGLPVVIPLCLVLAVLIWIDHPGPIFFAHYRIGKNGVTFPCYKFRSMIPNAQDVLEKYLQENPEAREEWESDFKLKNDPRVTKLGAFLRRTSLDEFPQLLNVLKGEMSLVGPRPIVKEEIEKYGEYIQDYYLVSPGITGMWQVSGRSDTTYEERVSMDSWYVRNWSVWIDVMYLLKTFGVVIKGKGAY